MTKWVFQNKIKILLHEPISLARCYNINWIKGQGNSERYMGDLMLCLRIITRSGSVLSLSEALRLALAGRVIQCKSPGVSSSVLGVDFRDYPFSTVNIHVLLSMLKSISYYYAKIWDHPPLPQGVFLKIESPSPEVILWKMDNLHMYVDNLVFWLIRYGQSTDSLDWYEVPVIKSNFTFCNPRM